MGLRPTATLISVDNKKTFCKVKSFVAPTGQWWVEEPPYGVSYIFQAA
ncbi:MAG: hypothetical protein IJV35_07005 [Neisseriaceae bacterium]|nr:hypothetical protein [Neisseriaceae bacterium]